MGGAAEEALRREYVVGEEIGRGRFGTVRRCYAAATGEPFALKTTPKAALRADPLDLALAEQEPKVHHLASAASRHVVALHAAFVDADAVHLVLDLCAGGDLFALVSARGALPEPAWFGDGRPMTGLVGTPYYVAPEVVAGREYTEKVDVWSAGVVLYMMLSGTVPFSGATAGEIFQAVLRGNLRFPPRAFAAVSPEAKDLLRRMLCRDVWRRLSAEQVLSHPWIVTRGGSVPGGRLV